jgi:hypothetical protein
MEGGALRRFCRLFMPFLIALAALQFQKSEQLRTSISGQDARWPYSQDGCATIGLAGARPLHIFRFGDGPNGQDARATPKLNKAVIRSMGTLRAEYARADRSKSVGHSAHHLASGTARAKIGRYLLCQ